MTVKLNLTAIKKIDATEVELRKLADDYDRLIVNERTIKDVSKARIILKNKRLEIENTVKQVKAEVKKQLEEYEKEADFLIEIIKPVEVKLHAKEKKVKDDIETRQLAKVKAYEDRKRAIRAKINYWQERLAEIPEINEAVVLEKLIQDMVIDEFMYEELGQEANEVKDTVRREAFKRIGELNAKREETFVAGETYLDMLKKQSEQVLTPDDDKPIVIPTRENKPAIIVPKAPAIIPQEINLEGKGIGGLMRTLEQVGQTSKPLPFNKDKYHWISYGNIEFAMPKSLPFNIIAEVRKSIIEILNKHNIYEQER